jgi:hypothetical protein
MRALTLKPEYAEEIAAGRKHIENCSWGKNVRGEIAIHRGGENGAIIALATVVDVVSPAEAAVRFPKEANLACGPLCWLLARVTKVGPIPCKGRLSLWKVPAHIKRRLTMTKQAARPEGKGGAGSKG